MPDKKQIPFRYIESELDPYFKELFVLQHATKRNEALTYAVKIAGQLLRKIREDIKTGKIKKHKYDYSERDTLMREIGKIFNHTDEGKYFYL